MSAFTHVVCGDVWAWLPSVFAHAPVAFLGGVRMLHQGQQLQPLPGVLHHVWRKLHTVAQHSLLEEARRASSF